MRRRRKRIDEKEEEEERGRGKRETERRILSRQNHESLKGNGNSLFAECTEGQNPIILRHRIILFPTSPRVSEQANERTNKCSGACERSKQCGASE